MHLLLMINVYCYCCCILFLYCGMVMSQEHDSDPNLVNEVNYEFIENRIQDGLDPTVDRCQDFYLYACGGFIKKNIPGYLEQASLNLKDSLVPLLEKKNSHVPLIERKKSHTASPSSLLEKKDSLVPLLEKQQGRKDQLSLFYSSCKSASSLNIIHIDKMIPYLTPLDKAPNAISVMRFAGELSRLTRRNIFLSFSTTFNPVAGHVNILKLIMGGISLPNKKYYMEEDFKDNRIQFIDDIKTMLMSIDSNLSNTTTAFLQARKIFELEKEIAMTFDSDTSSREQLYEENLPPNLEYPSLAKIKILSPTAWTPYIEGFLGKPLSNQSAAYDSLSIAQVEKIIENTNLTILKLYIKIRFILSFYPVIDKLLEKEVSIENRNYFCAQQTLYSLPGLVGMEYQKSKIQDVDLKVIQSVIHNVKNTLLHQLKGTQLRMDPETRQSYIKKLKKLKIRIAQYDDKIPYNTVNISSNSYFENVIQLDKLWNTQLLALIGKPIQPAAPILATDAYYSPKWNRIDLQTAILQSPIFNRTYPDPVMYGSLGFIISHEMGHAFDPVGIHYDHHGNYRQKWTSDEAGMNTIRQQWKCFVNAYSRLNITSNSGHVVGKVNGAQTAAENVADCSLTIAHKAFLKYGTKKTLGNLTSQQLFFVSAAQTWCTLDSLAASNPQHTSNRERVTGIMQNSYAFAKAFNCPKNSTMNPPRKCTCWS